MLQMCMICLDTDSKLSLMSKHKLEEAYEQLTGLSLCRGGNLKQTLCVLCAQRLINFSRFRDLCLRAHSLMTDLHAQDESITIKHIELMNCTMKHLKFNLTQTTLAVDHCDLYVDHTDEEEQTAAEESVVGDVETVVVKTEDNSNDFISTDHYSNISIKLETCSPDEDINESLHAKAAVSRTTVPEHVPETENFIKIESVTFGCTLCSEDFMQENEYYEHMSKHLKNAGDDDASQVCEPRAAVSRSGDSLVLQNKPAPGQRGDPPKSADFAQGIVAPLSGRLAANNENKVQATEEEAIQNGETIYETKIGKKELDNRQNCVFRLYAVSTITNKQKEAFPDENASEKPRTIYTCEICNQKCANRTVLVQHMRTHTGERPFTCNVCNYKCSHNSNLTKHKRIHTDEKPYSCEMCNYKCAEKSNLTKHKKIHTAERRYTCEICNYKCAQKYDLNKHERIHTGEKPYSCEICQYKCTIKSTLLRHKQMHTGEKPFTCKICNCAYADKRTLVKHMKTHTGE